MRFQYDIIPPELLRGHGEQATLYQDDKKIHRVQIRGRDYTFAPDKEEDRDLLRRLETEGSVVGEIKVQRDGIHFVSAALAEQLRREAQYQHEAKLLNELRSRLHRATVQRRDVDDVARLANMTAIGDAWMPGYRKVLSGLTAKSNGTGTNANTVAHIVPSRDVTMGKLKRESGQPLCTANTGSFGMKRATNRLGDEGPSCQGCLRTIQKKAGMSLQEARETVFEMEEVYWRDVVGESRSAFFVALEDADGNLVTNQLDHPRWYLVVADDQGAAARLACSVDDHDGCFPRLIWDASKGDLYTYAHQVIRADPQPAAELTDTPGGP